MKRPPRYIALLLSATALAACGGTDEGHSARPIVSAAASLKTPFEDYAKRAEAGRARFSFAGSDELAQQIRRGARPDVFASADPRLTRRLFAEGRVRRPEVFASNRLVIAVPRDSARVRSITDLGSPGIDFVIGDESVPIGAYTRRALAALGARPRRRILANVRSVEPNVEGILGKLAQGSADAGLLYATDVRAAPSKLKAIQIPDSIQPRIRYSVAIVAPARHVAAARSFVRGLLDGEGRAALRRSGFGPAP